MSRSRRIWIPSLFVFFLLPTMTESSTSSLSDHIGITMDPHGAGKEGLVAYPETRQAIDIVRQRFPYCLVWSPIPLLTYEENFDSTLWTCWTCWITSLPLCVSTLLVAGCCPLLDTWGLPPVKESCTTLPGRTLLGLSGWRLGHPRDTCNLIPGKFWVSPGMSR